MVEENDSDHFKRKSVSMAVISHKPIIKLTPFQTYSKEQT